MGIPVLETFINGGAAVAGPFIESMRVFFIRLLLKFKHKNGIPYSQGGNLDYTVGLGPKVRLSPFSYGKFYCP
jgi:hypothetical protein